VSVLLYTIQRLMLLLAAAGVLYLVGARGLLLWALAFLLSGVVSLVLLRHQRDAISARIAKRQEAQNRLPDEPGDEPDSYAG
jgi:hypothetical protein